MASDLGIGYTNYNKLENGNREPSVKELQLLAKLFDMTVDQILNYEGELTKKKFKDFFNKNVAAL